MAMPHELPRHFWAISIEGIGDEESPPGSQHNGWLITTSGARPYIPTIEARTDWTVRPWLQVDSLDVAAESVEIFEAHIQWGAVSGELMADDMPAERLLYRQFKGDAIVDSYTTSTTTTIELDDTTLEGEIVYVGDETIELTNHQGSGTYDCIRGQYSSVQRAHEAGAPVFTQAPPEFDARRVRLFAGDIVANSPSGSSDPGVVLTQKQVALLVGNVVQEKGGLSFSTRAAGARLKEIEGGEESREITGDDLGFIVFDEKLGGLTGQTGQASQILKPEALSATETKSSAIQVGDYAYPADVLTDTAPTPQEADGVKATPTVGSEGLWGKTPDRDLDGLNDDGTYEESMYEIFAVDQERDVTPLNVIADQLGDKYRYHRLTYYAAFHLSTRQPEADVGAFDVLRPDWSLNAEWLFVDDIVSQIKTLIDEYDRPRERVRRIALGKNNEPWEIRRYCIQELLHPFYYESVTASGELTIERARTPDIEDIDGALGRPVKPWPGDTLKQDPARDRTKSSAQITVGDTSMTDGRSVIIRNDEGLETRAQDFENGSNLDVKASVADPTAGDGQRTPPIAKRVRGQLQLQGADHPLLTFLAPDPSDLSASYRLGELIKLDNLNLQPEWIVDNSGNRVSNFSEIESTGLVVRRRLYAADEQRSRSYELGVLFVGDTFTRWRAPSGKIQSVTTSNSNHVLTLGADNGGDSQFGLGSADASYFTTGDEVELYNRDGTYWGSNAVKEITDVSGTDITVDGTWSTEPPTGLYVRLAYLDSDGSGTGYENAGLNGAFDNIDRAYIYCAETDGTIGDAETEADTYGV